MKKDTKRFIGKRFDLLVVKDIVHRNNRTFAICKCDCGAVKEINFSNIRQGRQGSCGCRLKFMRQNGLLRRTHGLSNTRLYDLWTDVLERCYREKDVMYQAYGAQGIRVCPAWKRDFVEFYNWAMANGYKDGLLLIRRNLKKGYNPENCYFGTKIQAMNNRSDSHKVTYRGRTQTIAQWARELKTSSQTIQQRLDLYGWTPEEAIGTPIKRRRKL